ncbi:neurofilament heavy polypeptide-like isoform X2 [Ananas comosus]|uniref:Neurofilament heavy polypeptide-like isoform X2 n=1 Tax=Ananas comosus TaxID=4615 RepID=A0A6P5GWW1_ANACO|nr:neurofilament heavy polypeptide-like isoform X2 [Ananas comosus]
MANAEKELEERLREVGGRLGSPPGDVDELLALLDEIETLLSRVEQSPSQSMSNAIRPAMKALVANAILRHDNMDVRVAVASCISEITRITAPDAPYDDDVMKEVFQRIVESFDKLDDMSSRSYPRRVSILETVAKVRSCVVMLDLECDDLILDMFRNFLKTISSNHPESIFSSMETIMTLVIEESEDISKELVSCLLDSVRKGGKEVLPISFRLGEKVIGNCVEKLKPAFVEFVKPSDVPLNEYSKIVSSLCDENADTAGQNDVSGADDSKQSERTVSDELPQESTKVEEKAGDPEEDGATSNKLSRSAVSNGTVAVGNGESLQEPAHPKEKSGKSRRSGQSKSTLPNNEAETKDHSMADGDNETPVVLGRRKGRGKQGDDAQPDGTSGNKIESSVPVGFKKTVDLQTVLKPHNVTSDSASRKGRPLRSIGSSERVGESSEADNTASSGRRRARAKGQVQDEKLPSKHTNISKDLEAVNDSEGKPSRRSSKKEQLDDKTHGIVITDVEPKVQRQKEKEGSAKKIADGESSQKRRKINFKNRNEKINSEEDASEDVSLKEMISREIAMKAFGKEKGILGESGGSKKKRGHGSEEASASRQKKDLNERLVGSRIKVWWPEDQTFYDGSVESFDPSSKMHKIIYDDGDVEILRLKKERWELIEGGSKTVMGQVKDVLGPDVSEVLEIKKPKGSGGRPPKQSKEETPSKSGKESSGGQEGDHPKGKGRSKGGSKTVAPSNDNDGSKSSSKSIEKASIKNKEEKTPKGRTRNKKEGSGEVDAKSIDALSGVDETSKPDRISMSRSRNVTATSEDDTTAGKKRKRRIATPKSGNEAKVTVGSSEKAKVKVQNSKGSGKKVASSERAKSKVQESKDSGKRQESSEKAKSKVQDTEGSRKKLESSDKAKSKKLESSDKAKSKKLESSEKAKSKVQESKVSGKKLDSSEKAKPKVQESEGSGGKLESSEKAKPKIQESEGSGKKLESFEKATSNVQESEVSGNKVDSSEKDKSNVLESEVSGKLESSEKAKLKVQESEGSEKEDSSEKAKSKVQENEGSGKESSEKAKLKVQESKGSGKKLDLGSAAAKAQGSETSAGKKRRRTGAI